MAAASERKRTHRPGAAWLLLAMVALSVAAPSPCLTSCPDEDVDGCLAVCLTCGACMPQSLTGGAPPERLFLAPAETRGASTVPSLLAGPPSEILHVPRPPSVS